MCWHGHQTWIKHTQTHRHNTFWKIRLLVWLANLHFYCLVMQLRNLVWATTKHDVYLMSHFSVVHWSSLNCSRQEVLNVSGHVAPSEVGVWDMIFGLKLVLYIFNVLNVLLLILNYALPWNLSNLFSSTETSWKFVGGIYPDSSEYSLCKR